ncbi:Protein CBG09931 [Caenorhabditis briggsae]|uniref:Protein CBG09931 n=1 Tax=Caenorhabditis briggsae TaxID=6238 RepID=A8X9Z5_CAEBR|nr:Protein CBG09931 [Caenorhabditis briggsae]CAP29460.1 Protein CBG09931 [Caenorhabditis briggsae]
MFAKTLPLLLFSLLFLQIDAQCGTGAIYVQQMNKCLQFYSSAVNYATAESVCSTLNGHMVSVHNMNENTYLAQQASQLIYKNGPVWLGAKTMSSIVTDPTSWKWEDGSPFDFQNYKIGQPSSLGTSACMQFFANDGQWLTATCTDSSPFICASDPPLSSTTACPPSQAISNTGIKVDYTKNLNIWIGLYYSDGYWKWIDGTPADYANWASREPNNVTYGMSHKIVFLISPPSGVKWVPSQFLASFSSSPMCAPDKANNSSGNRKNIDRKSSVDEVVGKGKRKDDSCCQKKNRIPL